MKKKILFVFDIDGTLTDSVFQHQSAFVKALDAIGVEHINDNFKSYKHHTDSYIARKIYETDINRGFSSSMLKQFEEALFEFIQNERKILEINGAQKVISELSNNPNIGICFATGSLWKPAIFKLDEAQIPYDLDQIVASNHLESREGIAEQAISQARKFYSQNSFSRIISVGDGLWDLKTAQNLSLEFIGIKKKNKKMLLENGASCILENWITFDLDKILLSEYHIQ